MPIKGAATGGVVTKEFYAYLGTNQAITTSTDTKVQIDTEVFDNDGVFDHATNYRYDPQEAGLYNIFGAAMIRALGSDKRMYAGIWINGSEIARLGDTTGGSATSYQQVAGNLILELDNNDYAELYVWHNHGSNRDCYAAQKWTYFGGCKLPT